MNTTLLAVLVLMQAPSQAQTPSAPAGQAAAPMSPQPQAAPAVPPDPYSYNPDGRRDPFLSLLGAGAEKGPQAKRGDGVAGMTVAEISVRGILQSRGTLIAMVQGPDNRTYMLRQGDRLADGAVQEVTTDGLVIMQEVNDPLSLVKQRMVRKPLRAQEDVKQ